jgi:hypothetical protein
MVPAAMPRRRRPYDPARAAHDRSGFYGRTDRVAFVEIDDPYQHPDDAAPILAERFTGEQSEVFREWLVPPPPKLLVARSRADILGNLHARRQIGDADYRAGREYQRIAEQATVILHAAGFEQRIRGKFEGVPSQVFDAARRLRSIDGRLMWRFGLVGIIVVRGALLDGENPKRLAVRHFADNSQRGVDWVARFLRETLSELAVICGYASRHATSRPPIMAWAAAAVVEAAGEVAAAG